MRIIRPLLVIICLLAVLGTTAPVHAADRVQIINNSALVNFPMEITFKLAAKSAFPITDIRLRYNIDQISFASVTSERYVESKPDVNVDVKWTLDMRKTGGWPPGTRITYWWVLTDSGGADKTQTEPTTLTYEDQRFSWQTVTDGQVTVHYYFGGPLFARDMLSSANQGLKKMAGDSGITLMRPLNIYIYNSQDDLLGALVFPHGWEGAVSYFEVAVIIAHVPQWNIPWGKASLNHEISHQFTYQLTRNAYNDIPIWLNEGLAMYAQGDMGNILNGKLRDAVKTHKLLSIKSLASPFSIDTELATLGYAESYNLVDFLINSYGQGKMTELLATFKQGITCDDALNKIYDTDTEGLDLLWQKYIIPKM